MDIYHIWCNLKDAVCDLDFVECCGTSEERF